MRRFKYLIQQFENLTTCYRVVAWWWLVFVVMPGWAAESKSVPPQNNSVSTSCKQVDDKVVEEWKKKVQKIQKSLPSTTTRGGGPELSAPLLFLKDKDNAVKFFAGQRKIHLAWEGGQKRYQVNVLPRSRAWNWSMPNLQLTRVSSEEREFKVGNYRVVVTDESNNPQSSWNFTAVDLVSQSFSEQFNKVQKDTSLNEVQKKWRLVALLLSYGEEWKLEAYQQIADQPKEKETDEFYWAWLGIKDGILPECQESTTK